VRDVHVYTTFIAISKNRTAAKLKLKCTNVSQKRYLQQYLSLRMWRNYNLHTKRIQCAFTRHL